MGRYIYKDYAIEILDIGKHACDKDWSWVSDYANWTGINLWFVYDGGATINVSDETYHIKPGDCFVFDLSEVHICTHNPQNPLGVYHAYIHIYDADGNLTLLNTKELPRVLRLENTLMNLGLWENLFRDHMNNEGKEEQIWFNPILTQVLTYNNNMKTSNEVVEKLCLEIINNPQKTFSLEELCDISGYSANHLIRLFKKYKNTSPYEYGINVKIDKAKSLILYSNMSITKIAQYLNYYDVNHFSKQFKSKVGISPRNYANQISHPLDNKKGISNN